MRKIKKIVIIELITLNIICTFQNDKLSAQIISANQVIYNNAGVYTFTVDPCYNQILVETYGAGGGGGGNSIGNNGGGGGAGGAYSRSTINVTPGMTYSIFVGAGGSGGRSTGNHNGLAGGDSRFTDNAGTNLVLAKGGNGGFGPTNSAPNYGSGGIGGSSALGIGSLRYSGGNGGNSFVGGNSMGGGGGSSAGSNQNGNNGLTAYEDNYAHGFPGGAAPNGGAQGGAGGAKAGACNYQEFPRNGALGGGGGGGAAENATNGGGLDGATSAVGGKGGDGKVVISFGPREYIANTGLNNWTAPTGITKVLVSTWGGGGGGGANWYVNEGGGGGGGGAFSQGLINVVPGNTYTVAIGLGGSAGRALNTNAQINGLNNAQREAQCTPGGNGGDTYFSDGTNISVLAKGGRGGEKVVGNQTNQNQPGALGGLGGDLALGIGFTKFSGGNGGYGFNDNYGHGGGGGGSASYTANGGNGGNAGGPTGCDSYGGSAGIAPAGGGNGGIGNAHWGAVPDGNSPGGGGAGAGENNLFGNTDGWGGRGGDGYAILDYGPVFSANPVSSYSASPVLSGSVCPNGQDQLIHNFVLSADNLNSCQPTVVVTGVTFSTTGTYNPSTDIGNFKLYYTTSPTFSTANLVSTISTPLAAGLQTFPSVSFTVGSQPTYLWITANLKNTGVAGRTIGVFGTSSTNIVSSISASNVSSSNASGIQTLLGSPTLSSSLNPAGICSGNTFTYTPTSVTTGVSFSWSRPVQSGINPTSNSGINGINESLVNNTSGNIFVPYTYTNTLGLCTVIQTFSVSVSPGPTATISGTSSVCKGVSSTVLFTTNSSGASPYIYIYSLNGSATSTVSGSTTASIVSTNTVSGSNTYSLISIQDANGCIQNQSGTAVITVYELPTASISGNNTVCQNTSSSVSFTGSSTSAPYQFVYSLNGTGSFSLTSSGTSTTVAVPTNSVDVYTYSLISVSDANCSNTQSGNAVVQVNSLPTGVLSNDTMVCRGTSSVTNLVFSGNNGQSPYTFTYRQNGVLQPTVSSLSGSSTASVLVPTGTAQTITYSLVSVSDGNGCSQTQSDVSVYQIKTPASGSLSTGSVTRVCQNETVLPTMNFTGGNGPAPYTFTYSLDTLKNGVLSNRTINSVSSSGTSSVAVVNIPTNNADTLVYIITGVADNSGLTCPTTPDTAQFIIDPLPKSTISSPGGTNQCFSPTGNVQLDFTAINVVGQITFNYTTQFGATYAAALAAPKVTPGNSPLGPLVLGTNTPNDTSIFVSAGQVGTTIYSNGISNSNVCAGSGSGTYVITVNPLPTASITANGATEICDNAIAKVHFTGSVGQPPFSFSYNINGGGTKQVSTAAGSYTVDITLDTVPGTYTVNLTAVSDQYNCNQAQTGSAVIRVDALPTAVSTQSTTICMNASTTINTATASNYSAINWTKTTSGTLTNANTLTPTYAAATADANTVVTLTMTATGTLACSSETATATYKIAVDSLPLAVISGSATICQNASKPITGAIARNGSILWTHNGQGSITGATTLTPTYTAAAGDANGVVTLTMTVTGTTTCTNQSAATYTIHVDPIPEATTSNSATICQNATYTLANGEAGQQYGSIVWTENGQGSITSGANSLTPTYTAAAGDAGSVVTLTMTVTSTNTCTNQTDQAIYNIRIDRLPTATAGGSKAICQDNSYTLQSGEASQSYGSVLWTENAAGTLSNANTLTPTYTAAAGDAAGVVTLTMTVTSTNTCNPQTSTAYYTIQVDPLPQVNVSGAVSICKGTTHTLPAGAATYTNGTIAWTHNGQGNISNANSLSPSYNSSVNESGSTVTLTLTVTSNNTCTTSAVGIVRDTYRIKVDSTPVAFAGSSRTICQNSAVTVGGTSYKDGSILWTHNGQGTISNATTLTPTYSANALDAGNLVTLKMVVSSNNSCAPRKDSAYYYVTIDRLPQVTLSGSTTICGNENHRIPQNAATANYGSILWIQPNTASGYISAGVNTLQPTYVAGLSDGGSVVTLTMSVTSTNTCYPASTYSTYPITVREVPTAGISGSTTLCEGDSPATITFTATGGTAPYTFNYSISGNPTQSVSTGSLSATGTVSAPATSAGQYAYNLLSVRDEYNCNQTQNGLARVTVNKLPEATITRDATVCQGAQAPTITITGSNGTAPYTFSYSINNNAQTPVISSGSRASFTHPTAQDGSYGYRLTSVSYTQGKSCTKTQTDSITIVVNQLPQGDLLGGDEVCKDSTQPVLNFKALGGTAPYTFTFKVNNDNNASVSSSTGQSEYYFDVKTDKAGTFNYLLVKVTDSKGCSTQPNVTKTVKVYDNPLANFVATPIRTTVLEPTIDIMESSISAETYSWSFGDGSKSTQVSPNNHTYKDSGRYEIKLLTTTFNGTCKDSMTQQIIIEQPKLVYIPNSFTPNEDGVNDVFKIEGEGIENLEMRIYDRWGNLVFYTNELNKGWDGRYKGELAQNDAYVYTIDVMDLKNQIKTIRGTVNLIR
jgi:gliding motility-associated-like protein